MDIALVIGISKGRVSQIIVKEKKRRPGAKIWRRVHLSVPIELPGPRGSWQISTIEGFDINARPVD